MYLALAEPNPHDRPGTKAEKAILRDAWGRWPEAKARLDRSHARSLVTYLADHPTDFRGAFARIRRELRSLYFSAFQSHLWNLMLARWIERATRPDQRVAVEFRLAALPIHHGLDPDQAAALASLRIPLPSARNPHPEGPLGEAAREVLGGFGLAWEDLRVRHLKDVFFSKGARPAALLRRRPAPRRRGRRPPPRPQGPPTGVRAAQGGLRHAGRQADHRRGGVGHRAMTGLEFEVFPCHCLLVPF